MPRALFLCGVPASGKSTHAQSLLDTGTYILLSSDNLIEEWATEAGLSYQEAYPLFKDKAKEELLSRLEWAKEMRSDIIWDQTNLDWEERASRLAYFNGINYDLIAVAFEADTQTLDDRLKAREETTGKSIPDDIITAQRDRYERPHYDEGFDKIILVTPNGAREI